MDHGLYFNASLPHFSLRHSGDPVGFWLWPPQRLTWSLNQRLSGSHERLNLSASITSAPFSPHTNPLCAFCKKQRGVWLWQSPPLRQRRYWPGGELLIGPDRTNYIQWQIETWSCPWGGGSTDSARERKKITWTESETIRNMRYTQIHFYSGVWGENTNRKNGASTLCPTATQEWVLLVCPSRSIFMKRTKLKLCEVWSETFISLHEKIVITSMSLDIVQRNEVQN